ncbi:hypothetical protein [Aminobacter aminovorans]|uniref:Uncharacterized protein n=1 Tax=Aminobacter aminovorans TaxID=83263 RepID=A0AAC9ASB8_AMIAI|nr:hypothetical protein [Aminobacter aminovorans]AMS43290.1 hypothetical protein AA2016_4375 [Aminobacter aminovorans]MBB3706159.1 hypothetical protein [Aminobacter aminovorans]
MPNDSVIREALAHARFKIEWANNHINAVEALVISVVAENQSVVNIQDDLETGLALVIIGPKQHIPVSLPLHIGDAIHALNSVWDYLWSGLARSIDSSLASKITAPRHEARKNLKADIDDAKGRHRPIHRAFPQAEAFVLDIVKPYNPANGGSVIWDLGKLDNISKHRLLIATPYVISFDVDLTLEGSDGGKIVQTAGAAIQTQGHPLVCGLTPPVKIHDEPKAAVTVVFGERDHFSAQPVVETLAQLVDATSELCNLFEKEFLGSNVGLLP